MLAKESAPLLSIILPTHNRADVIGFAIKSVLDQSLSDFELFIVGDGCTDQTAEVVQSFQDHRIRWMDLPKGPNFGYANRNIAFRQARGKYIGFMAHDDLLLPDHFARCIEAMESEKTIDLVHTRPLWVTRDGLLMPIPFNLTNLKTRIAFLMKKRNALPASCVVHRRSCFERFGYWNDQLPRCGDWDMWARIISGVENAQNLAFIAEPTCLHFVAIWKEDVNSGLREAREWRHLYENSEGIPAILNQRIPEGTTEQAHIWQQISEDPRGWSTALRKACIQVMDLQISHLAERMYEKHRALVKHREALKDLRKQKAPGNNSNTNESIQ